MGYYEFKESDALEFARASGSQTKQRGDELQFLYCPYCNGGKNKDKYSFSINLISGQFKCLRSSCSVSGNMLTLAAEFSWFSLGSDVEAYYQTGKRQKFRKFRRMEPLKPKPAAITYLDSRKITAATAEKYQITVQSKHENILVFPFLDEKGSLQFVKYRKTDFNPAVDKGKEWCEANCKPILFGMYQCNLDNKTLVLTEGQIDSLSVAESGIENAVSVPNGKNGFTWVPYCWDWLQNFDTLIVFGDCENGRITLLDDMQRRFRGVVKAVRQQDYKGCKDANEILKKYGRDAVRKAVEQAEVLPMRQVKELADVKAVDLFSLPKIPTGIESLDKVLSGGIYLGQTVILTGKRGEGKSTLGSQILANALNEGNTVFAYSGELPDYFFKRWIDFQ
ncbi:MAG: ATPase domain-containing protein, partial [Blautia faecis]